jgi:hypothetical protein
MARFALVFPRAQLSPPVVVCGPCPATNTCSDMKEMLMFQGPPLITGAGNGTVDIDNLKMQRGADAQRTLATVV